MKNLKVIEILKEKLFKMVKRIEKLVHLQDFLYIERTKLNTKDKCLVLKAIIEIANESYNDQKAFILKQIMTKDKYQSDFGQFYSSINTKETTVAQAIAKKQKEIEKLQKEIEELNTKDNNEIVTELTYKLMSKVTDKTNSIAKDLLKDLYEKLDSKRISKSL